MRALKRGDIITYDDDTKDFILAVTEFDGMKYAYVVELSEEDEKPTNEHKVMKIYEDDDSMEKLIDEELLLNVLKRLKDTISHT